jgi:hypothetical protein
MESENSRERIHCDAVAASPLELLDGAGAGAGHDHQLSRTNNDGLSTRETPAGNIYSGVTLGGQTRAILGNVFYTTHNNVTNPSEQTTEEVRHESLMNTLAFDQMDFRKATVEPAHTRTCRWIFEEEAFLRWRDPAFRDTNHGFLWIKGKPGSGKSTLMKCILNSTTKHGPECTVISFFFNARGESLERSTEGCYRSLLHQILAAFPKLRGSIQIPHSLGKGQAFPITMLQNVLYEAVLSLQQEHLVLILDALDECDQKEVRSMIHFLGSLAETTELQGVSLNTCFASRHYPSITVRFCETLVVEQSKGHTQDILMYARDSLVVESDVQRKEILDQVMRKAEGVFLWVVLVVRILNEQFDEGRTQIRLLDAISDLPDDLDALIGSIISNGASDQHLLPTLLWVLSRAASANDVTCAVIKLGAGETSHLQDKASCEPSFVKRFVLHASKGLVESHGYTLQFIHESVRQHILVKGLAQLGPRFANNLQVFRDVYLAELYEDCLRHFQCPSSIPPELPVSRSSHMNPWQQSCPGGKAPEMYQLPRVARHYFWTHLDRAYKKKACVLDLVHNFPKCQYIGITNYFCSYEPTTTPATRSYSVSSESSIRPTAGFLHLLLSSDHFSPDTSKWDPFLLYSHTDYRYFWDKPDLADLVKDLLEHCATCTSTIADGHNLNRSPPMSCSEFLIGRDLDDYCGGRFGTPLIAAISIKLGNLVVLLLNAGADVNVCSGGRDSCREKDMWSPLSAAVIFNDRLEQGNSIIELLLDCGANIDIRSMIYGSALGAAAHLRQRKIVRLLLDRGADVNLEDTQGGNIALKGAVSASDNILIVKELVNAGAYAKAGSMDRVMFKTPCRFY